jgi:DNA-binding IclR family transcriptional regulator
MDYTVAAVDEALNLLFLVAQQPGLGLSELAKRSGNTKARSFRLLTTLEQRDMVRRRGDPATYCLGFRALHLGAAATAQIDLVQAVQEPLQRLGARFNETCAVRVRDGLETVCIAKWESTQSLRVHGEVGRRRPLYAGASSKLLLSAAPADVVEAVMAMQRQRFTATTPVSKAALAQEIRKVRANGYALSMGERAPDTAAIAVPVRDASGAVVAALSISTPATRMSEQVDTFLRALKDQALAASRHLGYVQPSSASR